MVVAKGSAVAKACPGAPKDRSVLRLDSVRAAVADRCNAARGVPAPKVRFAEAVAADPKGDRSAKKTPIVTRVSSVEISVALRAAVEAP
tara:strand:- start:149 stop:415 length:267 start_codon:yes stop_codon:yes gene_type:complete